MKQPGPIIKLFTEIAPPILREHFRADSCITSTRVTVEALATFGVRARPLSVRFVAMNALYFDRFRKLGRAPSEDEMQSWVAEGGWALGIDTQANVDGKYAGHVVAIAQDIIIDASARQFNRPERGLIIPDVILVPTNPRFLKGKGPATLISSNGDVAWYHARLDDDAFVSTKGWGLDDGSVFVTNAIVYAMAKKLGIAHKLEGVV